MTACGNGSSEIASEIPSQVLGGGGVAVDGVQRVDVSGAYLAQRETLACDLIAAHGQTLTSPLPQG